MKCLVFLLTALLTSSAMAQVDSLTSGVYRWRDQAAVKTDTGERKPILGGPTTTLAFLEVHATTLDPGKAPHASHSHEDLEEMVIVKEGTLAVTIADERRLLGPGSVAVVFPGDEHGFENAGDTPATYYVFRYRAKAPVDLARGEAAGGSFMVDRAELAMRESDKGGRRDYFDQPTAMFDRFEMHVTTLNEGLQSHPPHTHRAEEFILVIKSDVEEEIDASFHDATAGDLIFLASEIPHAIRNTGSGQTEYFAFQWE